MVTKRIGCPIAAIVAALAMGVAARAVPGSPTASPPQPPATAKGNDEAAAPTRDNLEATVAESAGPIEVANTVSDRQVQQKRRRLLPRYPGSAPSTSRSRMGS